MTLFACKRPDCSSENIRFDYSYNTLVVAVDKCVFAFPVDRHFQKQKILSWKA